MQTRKVDRQLSRRSLSCSGCPTHPLAVTTRSERSTTPGARVGTTASQLHARLDGTTTSRPVHCMPALAMSRRRRRCRLTGSAYGLESARAALGAPPAGNVAAQVSSPTSMSPCLRCRHGRGECVRVTCMTIWPCPNVSNSSSSRRRRLRRSRPVAAPASPSPAKPLFATRLRARLRSWTSDAWAS